MKKTMIALSLALCMTLTMPCGVMAQPADDDAASALMQQQPSVKLVSQGVELTAPANESVRFTIYSITGQLVKAIDVADVLVVELPQGCYIVKSKSFSKKIVVR